MKMLGGVLLIIASLYGGIYLFSFLGILDIPEGQFSASATKAIESIAENEAKESVFQKPVHIEWNGEIFSVLQSGNGYAIKNLDKKAQYPQFMAFWPGDKMEWIEGSVKIKGLMEGIDCAYQNTIFGGKCVPLIIITSLETIKK